LTSHLPHPPRPTLFPYTTLFRSDFGGHGDRPRRRRVPDRVVHQIVQKQTKGNTIAADDGQVRRNRDRDLKGLLSEDRREIAQDRSEEHTSELQSRGHLVCRLLLE